MCMSKYEYPTAAAVPREQVIVGVVAIHLFRGFAVRTHHVVDHPETGKRGRKERALLLLPLLYICSFVLTQ